jgi:hypothetical protein
MNTDYSRPDYNLFTETCSDIKPPGDYWFCMDYLPISAARMLAIKQTIIILYAWGPKYEE